MKFISMKIFGDNFGIPISSCGAIATITTESISQHISMIAAIFTILYTSTCIIHKIIMIKQDIKNNNAKNTKRKRKNEN